MAEAGDSHILVAPGKPRFVAKSGGGAIGDAPFLQADGCGAAGSVNERPHWHCWEFVATRLSSASAEGQGTESCRLPRGRGVGLHWLRGLRQVM